MQTYLNRYLKTLTDGQSRNVKNILADARLDRASLEQLIRRLNREVDFQPLTLNEAEPFSVTSGSNVLLTNRDAMLAIRELFDLSNNTSLAISSIGSVFSSQIQSLQEEITTLEKQVENYSLLLADQTSSASTFMESFSDQVNQEKTTWQVPDRDNRPFTHTAKVESSEGILVANSGFNIRHFVRGSFIETNGFSNIFEQNDVQNAFDNSDLTTWSITVDSDSALKTGLLGFSVDGGLQVTLEGRLTGASPTNAISIIPTTNTSFWVDDIVLYEDENTTENGISLISEPVKINSTSWFFFPVENITKYRVYLRQPTYVRKKIRSDSAETTRKPIIDQYMYISRTSVRDQVLNVLGSFLNHLSKKYKDYSIFNRPLIDTYETQTSILEYKLLWDRGVGAQNRNKFINIESDLATALKNLTGNDIAFKELQSADQIQHQGHNAQMDQSGKFIQSEARIPGSDANKYIYDIGIKSIDVGFIQPVQKAAYVSKPLPLEGDFSSVSMRSKEVLHKNTSFTTDIQWVNSVEYSISTKASPKSEEDWLPILPANANGLVTNEMLFPDQNGRCKLRFPAAINQDIVVYKNRNIIQEYITELSGDSISHITLLTPFSSTDYFTVAYKPVYGTNIDITQDANASRLVNAYHSEGSGDYFASTNGQRDVLLTNLPYIDESLIDSTTVTYSPVSVLFDDGTAPTNITAYSESEVQASLDATATGYQFIHSNKSLIFNKPVAQPFRVFYQYLSTSLRYRVVLRSTVPLDQGTSAKIDYVQFKVRR